MQDKQSNNTTRDEVIATAARLFHRKGYDGTSMSEIASAVGIQKSSLYYHFDNKESLLSEILNSCTKKMRVLIDQIFESDNSDEWKITACLQVLTTNPDSQHGFRFLESTYASKIIRSYIRQKKDKFLNYLRTKFDSLDSLTITTTEFNLCMVVVFGLLSSSFIKPQIQNEKVINQVVSYLIRM